MSRIKDRDTIPEMLLRRAVWKLGLRYRLRARLPGKPDLVFASARVVVFADGCFWHGCPTHFRSPKTNSGYWSPKIEANIARDRRNAQALRDAGWHVVRIWEHEIEENPAACALRVAKALAAASSAKKSTA